MSAKDVIIALDFPTREETLTFLDQFPAGEKPFVKIGMELFYACLLYTSFPLLFQENRPLSGSIIKGPPWACQGGTQIFPTLFLTYVQNHI